MRLNEIVATMPKKKLDLFKNLVSVGVILTITYSVFVIATLDNPMQFFNNPAFLQVALSLISLSFVWKILNGAEIVVPNKPKQQKQPQVKLHSKPKETTPVGSWQCPKCKSYVIGKQCPKCGYTYE